MLPYKPKRRLRRRLPICSENKFCCSLSIEPVLRGRPVPSPSLYPKNAREKPDAHDNFVVVAVV